MAERNLRPARVLEQQGFKPVGREFGDRRILRATDRDVNAIEVLRCFSMVVSQQAAEPLAAFDLAVVPPHFVTGLNDLVGVRSKY